jgi:F-type H+-transporting ATPase subunit b
MNRTLRLLSAALLGSAAVLFVTAGPASASGETIGACVLEQFEITEIAVALAEGNELEAALRAVVDEHPEYLREAEEIVEANDGDVEAIEEEAEDRYEDCLDAPNPLLPETNEIIWGAVGFTVVFLFLAKFGLPAAKKAMADRTAKIQGDLDDAEAAKTEAEEIKAEYAAKVADAKAESARIIEEARQAADQLKSDQQARLNEELAQARASAQADIDAAKGQAMAELRGEVSDIAIGAAEAVVGANLDRAAQTQLIEDYINRVQANPSGSNSGNGSAN